MDDVDASCLADAVDASGSLFEAQRGPGQFKVDHQTAATMKVEAFASRVGCEHQNGAAGGEPVERLGALARRLATVQLDDPVDGERGRQPPQRVAVFREHDCRLVDPRQQALQRRDLALRLAGQARQAKHFFEMGAFIGGIAQPPQTEDALGLQVVGIGVEQCRLDVAGHAVRSEQGETTFDRPRGRGGAAAGAPREHRGDEPGAVAAFSPDASCVLHQRHVHGCFGRRRSDAQQRRTA